MQTLKKNTIVAPGVFAVHVLVLAGIVYTWRFSHLWLDDFNNLYWVQRETFQSMLGHVINPLSEFFRPVGMFVYWMLWQTSGLHPMPYHVLAWTLHFLNAALLYVLLARIVESRYAAAFGSLLFTFRANFVDIYWSFGFIFELLACGFMLSALLIHMRDKKSWRSIGLVLLLAVLAIKSKEMAITLPALLFAYDVTHRRRFDRKTVLEYACLAVIALWFAHLKVSTMGSASPDHSYYMDLRVLTLGRGLGWYFDRLYDTPLRWGAWMIISVIASAAMLYRREHRGIFFLAYIFISLMPVVFLVNHRGEFYWYIPFFGVAGMAAVMVDAVSGRLEPAISRAATPLALIFFFLFAAIHIARETRRSAGMISGQRTISEEYAGFLRQLGGLPAPSPGETVYYRSFPDHFSLESLQSVTQVVFRRTDVKVDVVQAFPDPCGYCLEYQDRILRLGNAKGGTLIERPKEK